MNVLRAAVAIVSVLGAAGLASADERNPVGTTPSAGSSHEVFAVSVQTLPVECRIYTWIPADARDDVLAWNQLLSLAACLQDGSVSTVTDPDQLEAMVDQYTRALEIPMMVYTGAIEQGPRSVQLRAAYQIAMAHVSLIVRARSSIIAPDDLATNPEAALRYRELHAQLEPLLARSVRIARVAFAAIDRAATRDPTIATDPVAKSMVRSARAMLEAMGKPAPKEPSRESPTREAVMESGEPMSTLDPLRVVQPSTEPIRYTGHRRGDVK